MALPPGSRQPRAVQMLRWMFRPIPFMERCRARYGPVFRVNLSGGPGVVVIGDPAIAMDVLSGDPEIYDSGRANLLFRPVVGEYSLLLLDGADHMRHRRILLPQFTPGHVQRYADQIERTVERRIATWPIERDFTLALEMEAITYAAISAIVFGDLNDPRLDHLGELMPEMMDRCDSPFTLLPQFRVGLAGFSPFARLMRVVAQIDRLLHAVIEERRQDPLLQLRDDVLSLLLQARYEDGTPLGTSEIRDELITLLMAGYETATAGLTWAFERIVRTPAAHDRLVEEIDRGEDTYLDAVVKETLRARPVVPIVARKVREAVSVAGCDLPAGTVLMVSVYLVHNDPGVYPEPEVFRPERFLGGLPDARAWIPFGGGVRRCLGASFAQLEMKTVLRTTLRELELSAPGDSPEPAVRRRFTFVPKGDGAVRVRRGRRGSSRPSPEVGTRTAAHRRVQA